MHACWLLHGWHGIVSNRFKSNRVCAVAHVRAAALFVLQNAIELQRLQNKTQNFVDEHQIRIVFTNEKMCYKMQRMEGMKE